MQQAAAAALVAREKRDHQRRVCVCVLCVTNNHVRAVENNTRFLFRMEGASNSKVPRTPLVKFFFFV